MAALDKMRTQLGRALGIPEEPGHDVCTLVDGVKGRLASERVHDFPGPTLPVHHGDAPEARRLNRGNAEVLEPWGERAVRGSQLPVGTAFTPCVTTPKVISFQC